MLRPESSPEPSPCRRGRQASACALLAVVFAIAWSWTLEAEAFVSGIPVDRPAGHSVIVSKLPEGMTCLAARGGEAQVIPYGETRERQEWDPIPQWRGEKSFHPSKELQADKYRQWYHFDAEGKTLGHLAQAISTCLRGKNNPLYDPIRDVGAFVIVTNCERVRVSGKKYHYKLYLRNTVDRPGHMKVERFKDIQKRFPERIIMRAVWGSLPKTPTCKRIFKDRLKLFAGPNHLYYHKDPVQYPMHTIKDCTPTQNKRRNLRVQWLREVKQEKDLKVAKWEQEKEDNIKLKLYKKFLHGHFKKIGTEAAGEMTLKEMTIEADKQRMQRIYTERIGQEVQKPAPSIYIKSGIERKRIGENKPGAWR
ncbi:unnamed protein product [Polarella glacialis]|uniref:Uncharacterized protein n=1 Tax=Polarella glacialis TaxID=89957 RepID=A0A813DGT5_POLGL|nr:unnamed protein product [Polarella glacialis]